MTVSELHTLRRDRAGAEGASSSDSQRRNPPEEEAKWEEASAAWAGQTGATGLAPALLHAGLFPAVPPVLVALSAAERAAGAAFFYNRLHHQQAPPTEQVTRHQSQIFQAVLDVVRIPAFCDSGQRKCLMKTFGSSRAFFQTIVIQSAQHLERWRSWQNQDQDQDQTDEWASVKGPGKNQGGLHLAFLFFF